MYWFTRKAKLRTKLLEIAHDYSGLMDKSAARIEELERQLKGAEEESSYFIGVFSIELNRLKRDLTQLKVETELDYTHIKLWKLYSRPIGDLHYKELEEQIRLIEVIMSLRQEYQQTE